MRYMTRNVSGCARLISGGSLALAGGCLCLVVACGGSKVSGAMQPTLRAGTGATPPVGTVAGTGPSTGVAGTGSAATGAFTGGVAGIGGGVAGVGTGAAGTGLSGIAGTVATGASGTGAAAGTGSGTAGTESAAAGSGSAGTGGVTPPGGTCLDGITDYEAQGPFMFTAKAAGAVKLWVPMVKSGCGKVPVVHLANGTGATCSAYQGALERLASHGFLTACYEDTNTGAGTQGVMAFDTALKMFPDLADNRLGSTGHSQGGQAAFVVLELSEEKWGPSFIYAGLAMEPASGFGTQPAGGTWQSVYGKIKSPMFMFSGTADMLVSEAWVQQAYAAMNKANEVYWWSAIGATHIPTPVGPEQEISIPWFRWKLIGDGAACDFFKKMPGNGKWDKKMSENEAPCH
jgi:hypothetical protein